MLQKLMKRLIFTSIIGFLCVLSPYGQAEDVVQDVEFFDTTDEDSNELEIKALEIKDRQVNDNNLSNIPNNAENSELKICQQGKIIALNKITATSKEMLLKLNEPQYFGNIQIKLHKCIKNLDPYNGDNYMLLTITEHKIDEDPMLIFQGWLISSSISVSTFEHPIYEIFAKDCL
ncbi:MULTISPECIES: DUF2155 domain-containing protein [Rickettsieae]|uniref:DUF2155 domain-containing protein n=2 Tax=Rickettsiaceae TaxID=775 RepID=UPI000BC93142|nr:DUF2155 domain-containing protein [Rickettsia endosymbiont of Culicoides newsteadi]OZG31566.1 hypothetical protein RiCNE_10370 [Rickettsia endosymbiont of Culicoides newsteadi]HJD57337.1 DUF2155 domain-containing protein [Rickettsia endosymbiont of Sericostoma sp. HW-2014]